MPRGRYNKNRGRGGGRGRGRGGGGGGGGGSRQYQDNRVSFQDTPKHNEKFERFYNTLELLPESEKEAFWSTLRRELPNSFRFTGSKGHALSVREKLTTHYFPLIKEITHYGEAVDLPKEIAWYPEGLAYSMTTPKHVIRKYEPFKEFQKWLVSETGVGNISRQEEVSMIPPLLLDVRPEHTVLDLCAAPGSKSAQLIEAIHAGEEERVAKAIKAAKGDTAEYDEVKAYEDNGRTTGLLVANDVNYQRAQMLVHQVKRLNSPNLIVTNHDATMFPSIELPSQPTAPGEKKQSKYLKFDRILADVPCSGDGTARKNPGIWKEWGPKNALGLYITQVRILTRSLQMLKVGGRVVYSTCSMNPIENEAVVSSAIERCGGVGKVRLIDCSDKLPRLKRNKGLEDWSVMAGDGRIYESFAEAQGSDADVAKIVPGMFPPGDEEQISLRHCMRVYPHQQDTGGFFIAVLEKLSEIKAKGENDSKSAKRDWVFTKPQEETAQPAEQPKSLVGSLIEEIEHPKPVVEVEGDMSSAAARQNKQEGDITVNGAGIKRPAPDDQADESTTTKRARTADGSYDEPTPEASGRPLPPQVEMAVEAATGNIESNGSAADIESAETAPGVPPSTGLQPPPRRRRRDNEPANEESFKYLSDTHAELESIYAFYELHDSFPRTRFLVRNPAGDPVKGIYYSSQLVKDILVANEGRGMKFVHAGVKMFMKQDVQGQADVCRWRIQTEGLPIVEGWVGEKRTVRLWKRSTLRKLLVEMFPKIGAKDSPEGEGWRALGEIGEQCLNIGMGCCVLRVEARGGEDGFEEPIVLPLWRSLHSLNLMLPKEERKAMLLRLFGEDVELVNHSDRVRKEEVKFVPGSIAAEDMAKELKDRIKHADDDDEEVSIKVNDVDGEAVGGSERLDDREAELADIAADDNAVKAEDDVMKEEMELEEDENLKVARAMPERAGESDEANTTV